MKKGNIKVLIFAAAIIVSIFAVGYRVGADNMRQSQWEARREVITVAVCYGDTLDGICYQYKPSWMDIREYRYEVMKLNHMESSTIYANTIIRLYI